jgi:hypothetical protein
MGGGMVALYRWEVMNNDLKNRIYAEVRAAIDRGAKIGEFALAQSVGEVEVKGGRPVTTIAFSNAMQTMTSKRWLAYLKLAGQGSGRPRQEVVMLGPVPMPVLPPDGAPLPGPPLTVTYDPTLISKSAKGEVVVSEKLEIVDIKLPASLRSKTPITKAAAAKDMGSPIATTKVIVEPVATESGPQPKLETPVADIALVVAAEQPLNVVEALQQEVDKIGQEIAMAMQQIEHHNQEIEHLSQKAAQLAEKKSVLVGAIEVLS